MNLGVILLPVLELNSLVFGIFKADFILIKELLEYGFVCNWVAREDTFAHV
jgi:hypothetical protein